MLLAHSGIPTEKQLIVIRIKNSIAEIAVLALSENGYIFNFLSPLFVLIFTDKVCSKLSRRITITIADSMSAGRREFNKQSLIKFEDVPFNPAVNVYRIDAKPIFPYFFINHLAAKKAVKPAITRTAHIMFSNIFIFLTFLLNLFFPLINNKGRIFKNAQACGFEVKPITLNQ